jgi:hypothetical protein
MLIERKALFQRNTELREFLLIEVDKVWLSCGEQLVVFSNLVPQFSRDLLNSELLVC